MKDTPVTTAELKEAPEWPAIEAKINQKWDEHKLMYPNNVVTLLEKKTCWFICVDGVPDLKLDAARLKQKHIK
nr:hypothetical protein [uncultured Arsenicibacter sp.]